jgi:hypothetical protein
VIDVTILYIERISVVCIIRIDGTRPSIWIVMPNEHDVSNGYQTVVICNEKEPVPVHTE